LSEKIIELNHIDPVDLYGVNENKLSIIKKYFPKLKLVARGGVLKVIGDDNEINVLERKLSLLLQHLLKYKKLSENNIERIMDEEAESDKESQIFKNEDNILVYGNSGLIVKAQTVNQRRLVEEVGKNDMVFAIGPAGTGKSYTAVALAVRALNSSSC